MANTMNLLLLYLLLVFEERRRVSAETSSPGLRTPITKTITVQRWGRASLICNITDKFEVAWYHLSSEELTLLTFAEKTRTRKSLPFSYNKNESRFILTADREVTMAILIVIKVEEQDLGLYFCGSKAEWSQMTFARPIRLQFEEAEDNLSGKKTKEENTDAISLTEKVLMLVGVGFVALVFVAATIVAGTVVHKRAWRAGWVASRDSFRASQKRRRTESN